MVKGLRHKQTGLWGSAISLWIGLSIGLFCLWAHAGPFSPPKRLTFGVFSRSDQAPKPLPLQQALRQMLPGCVPLTTCHKRRWRAQAASSPRTSPKGRKAPAAKGAPKKASGAPAAKGAPKKGPSAPTATPATPPPPPPPPPARSAGIKPIVTAIRLKGLKHVKPNLVRRWIFLQEGEAYSRKTLLADLRRLRRTGFFQDISAQLQTTAGGLVIVTFVFKERRGRIRAVSFVGNRLYTSEQLMTQVTLRPSMFFDRRLLADDARSLISLYHSIGYFRAKVTVQGQWIGDELQLWFVIQEGPVAEIKRVQFRGNKKFSSQRLRQVVFTRKTSLGSWFEGRSFYHPTYATNDVQLLKRFFLDRGHLQHRVTGPRMEVSRDRKSVTLIYNIVEGPVFRFGKIQFEGDLLRKQAALRKMLVFRKGQVFSQTAVYIKSLPKIVKLYQNSGYYYTRIQPVPQVKPDRSVDMMIYLVKGPLTRIERIDIKGNDKTSARVIRKRILLKKGDLFHAGKLLRSRILLISTGYFDRTDPRLGIKVVASRGSADDKLILRFVVKEKLTILYNFGFNYLPIEGFVFAGQFGERNFLGQGQTLLGGGTISTTLRLWRIFAYFIEPYVFNTNLYFSVSGSVTHHDTSSSVNAGFIRDTYGGNIGLSHPLGIPQLRLSARYRLARVQLSPAGNQSVQVPIENYYSTRTTGSLRARLTWDTRNRAIGATKGWTLYGSYEHAAPYLGGDYSLHRLEGGGRLFIELPWKMSMRFAATVGWSYSPDANGVTPFERFPLDGSFFLMRGFLPFSIGPRRGIPSSGDQAFGRGAINWGGTKKIVFNAEFDVPIVRIPQLPVSFYLFFDAGNAYDDNENFFQDIRQPNLPLGMLMNVGFGFRLMLANVGVMRFEFGIPLTPRPGDQSLVFNLQVGDSF